LVVAACSGGGTAAPEVGGDGASTDEACGLLTELVSIESQTDGDDLASLRAHAPRSAEVADSLVDTAPSDIKEDARVVSDRAEEHLRVVEDPSLVLDPNVGYIWATDESLRAGEALREWAERNCAESIDRRALTPQPLSLCLPPGSTRDDVQALFERTSEPSPTGRGEMHLDGIVAVAAQSQGIYVELDRLITHERKAELLAILRAPPVQAVVEGGGGCD
jgi:hypothetical protein